MDIRYTRGLDEMSLNSWIKDPRMKDYLPLEGEVEQKNFSRTWMFYSMKKAGLSLVVNDINIGMAVFILMPYQKVIHHALLQIMIHPDFQRKGFGSKLLKNMLHLAKNYLNLELVFIEYTGPQIYLDFFLKHGFKIYATQRGYVRGSYPDKVLLEYNL
jgi:ribosomal protein S18 acetylase RimI-like enzyme